MMKHYVDKAPHRLIAFPLHRDLSGAATSQRIEIDCFIDFSINRQTASALESVIDVATQRLSDRSTHLQRDSESDR